MSIIKKILNRSNSKSSDNFMYSREFQSLEKKWVESSNDVSAGWSMLYNLKKFDGTRSEKYEVLCRKNIELFLSVRDQYIKNGQKVMPTICEGYRRLAMLYEKRKDYISACNICNDAISNGAVDELDKPKGMMVRYIRYAKKAGIELPE